MDRRCVSLRPPWMMFAENRAAITKISESTWIRFSNLKWSENNKELRAHFVCLWLTGCFEAGTVPTLLAAINWSAWLIERRLLPSKLPSDSPKPNSSPTLKPVFAMFFYTNFSYFLDIELMRFLYIECVCTFFVFRRLLEFISRQIHIYNL